MSPPRLNRRLALEAPVRTPDGTGGYVAGWRVVGTVWAEVIARTGREGGGPGGSVSLQSYRIVVPAAPVGSDRRPRPDQRFREGVRVFTILAIGEDDAGGRYLACEAREELQR